MATRTADLRAMSTTELERSLRDAESELTNVRFGLATRQTENTARIGDVKRQIARIRTILTEREQEA